MNEICKKCGKPDRKNKDQYSEYSCNCTELKDRFQTTPRIGDMRQGCNHNLPDGWGTGSVVGKPRRGDGKIVCNSCYAVDNFKSYYLIEMKTPDNSLEFHHHINYPIEHKIEVFMCMSCGNIQGKV